MKIIAALVCLLTAACAFAESGVNHFVPAADALSLLGKPGTVVLDYAEYEKLREKASQQQNTFKDGVCTFVSSVYTAYLESESRYIYAEGTWDLYSFSDTAEIPLACENALITQQSGDGAGIIHKNGRMYLALRKKGRITLQVSVFIYAHTDKKIEIHCRLPDFFASSLQLKTAFPVRDTAENTDTEFLYALNSGTLNAVFEPAAQTSGEIQRISHTVTQCSFAKDMFRYSANITVNGSSVFERITARVSHGRILSVEGQRLSDYSVNNNVIHAVYNTPANSQTLKITVSVPFEKNGTVPVFITENAQVQTGVLRCDSQYCSMVFEPVSLKKLTDSNHLAVYEYSGPGYSLAFQAAVSESMRASVYEKVFLDQSVIITDTQLTIHCIPGMFQTAFSIPEHAAVKSYTCAQAAESYMEGSRIVFMFQEETKQAEIKLNFEQPFSGNASVWHPAPDNCDSVSGTVEVACIEGYEPFVVQSENISYVPLKERVYRFFEPFVMKLAISRKQPFISDVSERSILVETRHIAQKIRFFMNSTEQVESLSFWFDAPAENIFVGSEFKEKTASEQNNGTLLVIHFKNPQKGAFNVDFELSGENTDFSRVYCAESAVSSGFVTVYSSQNARFTFDITGLYETDPDDAPATGHFNEKIAACFSFASDYTLRVNSEVYERSDTVAAVITNMNILAQLGDCETYLAECSLHNSGLQFLAFAVDGFIGAETDSEPVKPMKKDGKLLIPVNEHTKKVRISYAPERSNTQKLSAPRFDIPVLSVQWNTYVPEGMRIVNFSGDVKSSMNMFYDSLLSYLLLFIVKKFGMLIVLLLFIFLAAVVLYALYYLIRRFDKKIKLNVGGIVFIVIIFAVLAAIAIPNYNRARKNTKTKACLSNIRSIESALEMYNMEHDEKLTYLDKSKLAKYFSGKKFPACPAGSRDSYYIVNGTTLGCSIHGTVDNPVPIDSLDGDSERFDGMTLELPRSEKVFLQGKGIINSVANDLESLAQDIMAPMVVNANKKEVDVQDIEKLRNALDNYKKDKGHYPPIKNTGTAQEVLQRELVKEGYIREIPQNPYTGSTKDWEIQDSVNSEWISQTEKKRDEKEEIYAAAQKISEPAEEQQDTLPGNIDDAFDFSQADEIMQNKPAPSRRQKEPARRKGLASLPLDFPYEGTSYIFSASSLSPVSVQVMSARLMNSAGAAIVASGIILCLLQWYTVPLIVCFLLIPYLFPAAGFWCNCAVLGIVAGMLARQVLKGRTALWIVLFVILFVFCSAVSADDTVILYDSINNPQPEKAVMKESEFKSLYNQAYPEKNPEKPGVLFTQCNYVLNTDTVQAEFSALLQITGEGFQTVAVPFNGYGIRTFMLNKKPASLDSEGVLHLKKGTYELTAHIVPVQRKTEDKTEFLLPAHPNWTGVCQIIGSKLKPLVPGFYGKTVKVPFQKTQQIKIVCAESVHNSENEYCSVLCVVDCTKSFAAVTLNMSVRSISKKIVLALPEGAALMDVNSSDIVSWNQQGRSVFIQLRSETAACILKYAMAKTEKWQIIVPVPQGIKTEGEIGFIFDEERPQFTVLKGVTRESSGEFSYRYSFAGEHLIEFILKEKSEQPRMRVIHSIRIDKKNVHYTCSYSGTADNPLIVTIPAGFTPVKAPGETEFMKGSRYYIYHSGKPSGTAEFVCPRTGDTVLVNSIKFPNEQNSRCILKTDEGIQYTIRSSKGLFQKSSGSETQFDVVLPVFSLEIETIQHSSFVESQIISHIHLKNEMLSVSHILRITPRYAGVSEFEFYVPAESRPAVISADTRQITITRENGVWKIHCALKSLLMRQFEILCGCDEPAPENMLSVPSVSCSADKTEYYVLVENSSSTELIQDNLKNLEKTSDFPAVQGISAARLYQSFYAHTGDIALSYKLRAIETAELIKASVRWAQVVTVCLPDEKSRTRAMYKVKNSAEQFLKLKLPADADIWQVKVQNRSVRPSFRDGVYLVPLEKTSAASMDQIVVIVYESQYEKGFFTLSPSAPEVVGMDVVQTFWTIGLLDKCVYPKFFENMDSVSRNAGEQEYFRELDNDIKNIQEIAQGSSENSYRAQRNLSKIKSDYSSFDIFSKQSVLSKMVGGISSYSREPRQRQQNVVMQNIQPVQMQIEPTQKVKLPAEDDPDIPVTGGRQFHFKKAGGNLQFSAMYVSLAVIKIFVTVVLIAAVFGLAELKKRKIKKGWNP